MSRPRPWLPNATAMIAGARPLDIGAEAWERIERALANLLDQASRDDLAQICGLYMALRQVELEPPLLQDAIARIEALENAASSLGDALEPLLTGDDASERVRRLLDISLREIETAPAHFGALAWIRPLPDLLLRSAQRTREKLQSASPPAGLDNDRDRENETKAPNVAWEELIRALADFAEARGMRASARGDYEAWERTSPFVTFVTEVHSTLPRQYQRHTTARAGLSRPISDALKKRTKRRREE